MSIIWKKLVRDVDGKEEWVFSEETHVGLVMGETHSRTVRVMSDIYADENFVMVWNPEKKMTEEVSLGTNFELSTSYGSATVDIDPGVLALVAEQKRARDEQARKDAQARAEALAEENAKKAMTKPRVGSMVTVVSGRKVKKGTRGEVTWMGPGYSGGTRLGIKDAAGKTHWTDASNVEVDLPAGLASGQAPAGGWKALHDAEEKTRQEWEKTFPKKGDIVQNDQGILGKVFWARGSRLGFKRGLRPGKDEDPIWANAWEVSILNPDGTVKSRTTPEPVRVTLVQNQPQAQEETPISATPPESEKKARVNPLAHMPEPFCNIYTIRQEAGAFNAYGEDGEFIIRLPEKSARQIGELLFQ